ncbi:Sterile alpha motif [Dermatophagoides pteronyssinus]|uniref:Sterile alpha motif n=1 Tax=Dermatophagoides pteronyssinus TaxID=6956 RepID=A0ABQ8JSI7_DERPT|nr:Sterile alpha motif [Dermatophagoides pteronyssinus]
MAYVNVAEWTSQHVGDWLYGLDDSILPYVQFFVNNQINGCRLLLLSAQDLINLNINKIGHQEIILEAVELLRNLHYNITSETLQTIALRLACKSRALFNQLKKSAEKAAAAAAAEATTATTNFNHPISDSDNHHYVSQKKDKNKDKDKDKDHHHHQQQQQLKQQQSVESTIDLSPVSTTTLASVSDILSAVKDFISWIDRYPFDGQDKYIQARKSILQLSIELTSTAQRDQQFVQGPNEVIRQCCKKLADLCDRLVQELNDSLAIQAASLEVVTVTKNMDEDLGMHIHSSYSGIHVVGGLKYHSPAYLNGNIEEGDEIIQVNYQTVVGWQLKKLVASMRRFPTKLILTVKKRPRHHSSGSFTVVPQFALPLPEMSIIGNSSLPLGATLSGISNANIYNTSIMMSTTGGGGGQQYPPPSSSTTTTTTTTNQSINNNNNNNTQSQQQQFQSMHNNDNNNNNSYDIISSTTTTTNLLNNNNNEEETIKIDHNNQPQNRKPLSSIMISMSKMLNNNDNHENNNIDNFNQRNHLDHHRNNHNHNQSAKIIENNNNHSKSFKNRNRLIQQQQRSKCQSSDDDDDDDDSSPLSDLSDDDDDSSTMFSTDSDTDSDCSNNRRHHHHHNHQHQQHRHSHHRHSHHHHHHQMNGKQQTNKKAKSNPITNVINLQTSSSSSTTTKMVMSKPTATITTITPSTVVEMRTKHDYCSSDHDEFENCEIECEEDIEEYNDNDSAFYSGRRTTTSTSTSTTSSKNDDTNKLNTTTTTAATAKSSSTGEKIKNLTNSFVKIRISKQKSSSLSSKENESIDSGDSGIRERDDNDVNVNVNVVNDERTDVKPRTSAEFEQLYLMQQNPASTTTAATSATLPNLMINMNKTTNKQQQSSTTKTLNTTKSFDNDHSMMMNRTQSLTSIQLSTITHLTSLAKNIRFANMAQVQQNNNVSLANNTHSKSKFDPVLASKIEKTIHKLSNGDLSMGNYHGYLFTYQGSERIGGNSLDIPTLGIITDQKQLKKWTKIRSVLKDNCLYSYLNDCTNIACFEIPIHLPGYYILVDKQMFLDQYDTIVNVNDNDTVNIDDNDDDTKTLKQLVIFKLVTYHRLFMFAVDSLNELVRWIVRFGYRFCCNPSERQLCFTYYLSPVHIGQLPSTTSTTVTNSNSNRSLSSKCSTLDSKEFESDDYHDLLTIKSNDSDDGSTQQNHHVKFQNVNCTSTNNDDNNKDAHRFIKSPHPRGSIRFAVRRSGQDMDFIDSTIDVKKTLSETFCSNTETLINDPPPPPPNLPPRPASSSTTQTITVPTTTQTTTTAITTTTATVTSDQIPRPKPRISKMAIMNGTSSTTTTTTVNNKVPTTLSSSSSCVPSSQSTTSNMITSAAQRLAPIPVPEKSTHISQTIQHFANLQRQNNLRRSFAQQQQQQQITTKNQQQQQQMNYADYDYIINNRPKQSTNDNQLKTTTTTTSNMNNPHCNMQTTIGNPLYCHVVPMLSNIADNSVHHQSTISSSSSTTTSSSSSSDHDVLRSSSLPPSIDPPPAPPLQSSSSLQTNENIAPIVPPKPNRNEFNKKEKEKDQIETPPPPPPILLPRRPINTGQQPPPIPTTSHPQLLRSNSNQQQRQPPPPIPPPLLLSSSTTKSNGGKFLNRSFSDATTKTSNSVSKTSNKNQRNNNQQRRPSLKSRHSLEESTQDVRQIENSSTTTCDDYDETGIFFDNNNNNQQQQQQQQSFYRTESIGSFDDQQPQTPTTSISTNFDISPTSLSIIIIDQQWVYQCWLKKDYQMLVPIV